MTDIKVGAEVEQVHATIVSIETEYDPKDPYDTDGEHAEGMFLGKFIAIFTKDYDGLFSTYREWHIFVRGFGSGFRTKLTDKFDICPDMWKDEVQYYESGQELGYVARNAFIFFLSGTITTEAMSNINIILDVVTKVIGA